MAAPKDFLLNSNYATDKVIGVVSSDTEGTVTVAAGGVTSVNYNNPVGDTAFWAGSFWIDGNSTKVPLGSYLAVNDDYSDMNIVFTSSVSVTVRYITNSVVRLGFSNNDSSSATIHFKVFLIAKSDQTSYDATEQNIFTYNTNNNYFKIASDTTYSIPSIGTTGGAGVVTQTTTIPHNLGYSPFIINAIERSDTLYSAFTGTDPFLAACAYVDDNNFYVEIANLSASNSSLTGTMHYRIYYDN